MFAILCTARYHHRGKFLRRGRLKYIGVTVIEFEKDVDRICYWNLLGTVKFLGYDLSKSTKLYYLEAGKTMSSGLKLIGNDRDVLCLANEMRIRNIVDIYIE